MSKRIPKYCYGVVALACLPALGLALPSCAGGYMEVDGGEAAYVEAPPVGIEMYPRYAYADGYVYDVNGRFYHRHDGRWVVYRHAPAGLDRGHREYERGRAEHQR